MFYNIFTTVITISVLIFTWPMFADAEHNVRDVAATNETAHVVKADVDENIVAKDVAIRAFNKLKSEDLERSDAADCLDSEVDFKTMSNFVFARKWQKASEEDRVKLVNAYKLFLIHGPLKDLQKYFRDEKIKYQFSDRPSEAFGRNHQNSFGQREYVIPMTIIDTENGFEHKIFYKMIGHGDDIKIYDILVDSTSALFSHRTQIDHLSNRARNIDELVMILETGKKN